MDLHPKYIPAVDEPDNIIHNYKCDSCGKELKSDMVRSFCPRCFSDRFNEVYTIPEAQPLDGGKTADIPQPKKTPAEIWVHQYLLNEGWDQNSFGVISAEFEGGSCNLTYVIAHALEAFNAQFATDAGGGKEFKGKRVDGNGYAYGNFFYWVKYGRKIPIIGIGIQNGSVMGNEVDPDTVTLSAPSTHSSSEMVEVSPLQRVKEALEMHKHSILSKGVISSIIKLITTGVL